MTIQKQFKDDFKQYRLLMDKSADAIIELKVRNDPDISHKALAIIQKIDIFVNAMHKQYAGTECSATYYNDVHAPYGNWQQSTWKFIYSA